MNYLKISKATELSGKDKKLYRVLEFLPGFLSWFLLLSLIILSYFRPTWVAYFIIAFDVYWLLLVLYLSLHLIAAYRRLKKNLKVDWLLALKNLEKKEGLDKLPPDSLARQGKNWNDIIHLILLPTYNEDLKVVRSCFESLVNDGFPLEKMIVVFAIEERAGVEAKEKAKFIENEFGNKFGHFLITNHPGNIIGELKGKGANQAWAGRMAKKMIIDQENLDYGNIIVSVFDIDTVVEKGYFSLLTYKFITSRDPYRASYQPIPVFHNNVWEAPFFARVAASSNTFWQMMQQIRHEKLATYSSHSMTFKALIDIDFWSTNMVSEDSRIFWHCYLYYNGDYRVEPLNFPISMDVTMDKSIRLSAKSLYKQQRRWGWGVENVPYLIFNTIKRWNQLPKRKIISKIFVQIHGFHSWATNAIIIGIISWLPMILGGDRFNITVLSGNLPLVTRTLMSFAMIGLVIAAIMSTLLLPKKPSNYGFSKNIIMIAQWLILPISIIIFGAIPGLEAQTRLMFGKYMGFWVTPKIRK
ncbi:MAG: glycosyltransferase family 2 protein [Patescibacteria group bacterium]